MSESYALLSMNHQPAKKGVQNEKQKNKLAKISYSWDWHRLVN
jgi:hypothetical protein